MKARQPFTDPIYLHPIGTKQSNLAFSPSRNCKGGWEGREKKKDGEEGGAFPPRLNSTLDVIAMGPFKNANH